MFKTVLESFLESFPDNKSLRHWLHWWHDRRKNIFRAFTGHDHPRCNQAEVVRASWKNRDESGLPLFQAAEFDTRDSIPLEAGLAEAMHTTKGKACGPTLTEMSERRNHRNIAGVARKGQDLEIWKLQKKCKRLAKYTNSHCRKVINVGTECIVIEGALTVPFNTNKAVAQKFYYCLDALCITNRPPWTNIRPLLEMNLDNDITDDRKKEIFSLLNI